MTTLQLILFMSPVGLLVAGALALGVYTIHVQNKESEERQKQRQANR